MNILLLVLFYLLTPLIINYFSYKYKSVAAIGPVIIAYFLGLLVGNIGIFPEADDFMLKAWVEGKTFQKDELSILLSQGFISEDDIGFYRLKHLQDLIMTITIPLALPLLLFSLNVRSWFAIAGKTFLSLLLGLISVLIPIVLGFVFFHDRIADSWKVGGMLTAVYSGGTPNLAAMKTALDVPSETYVLTHTYDLMLGVVFLFFVMTIGQRVLQKFLPAFKKTATDTLEPTALDTAPVKEGFFDLLHKKSMFPLLAALGIAILIFATGGGLSFLVPSHLQMLTAILSITTLGILISLLPRINRIEKTFDLGMYFILVFSIVVASMADVRNFTTDHIHIFYWVTLVYVGSLIIHVALSAIFKIDADNVIIVSTALSCSPPFVPVVAAALKNREIIISGLTVGIIGYAIGNYLGVALAYLLKSFSF